MSAVPQFKRAEKKKVWLKLGLAGPSGSGKTMSALFLASGIGKKIALADTENESAALYADRFEFDHLSIHPPFTTDKFIAAVKAANDAKYDVLVIDSISHAWAGEGGVIDKKEAIDTRGGNKYANWKIPKADHQKLKNAILQSTMHVIVTMRSKQKMALVEDEGGKSKVQKLGMDPIAEPGMEYEFTVLYDLDMGNNAMAGKDRTAMFSGKIFKISKETGEELVNWLNTGSGELVHRPLPEAPAAAKQQAKPAQQKTQKKEEPKKTATKEQVELWEFAKSRGWGDKQKIADCIFKLTAKVSFTDLTEADCAKVRAHFASHNEDGTPVEAEPPGPPPGEPPTDFAPADDQVFPWEK